MGGKLCIHRMRIVVGMIVGMLAEGHSTTEILRLYPYLETEGIAQALSYAALRSGVVAVGAIRQLEEKLRLGALITSDPPRARANSAVDIVT